MSKLKYILLEFKELIVNLLKTCVLTDSVYKPECAFMCIISSAHFLKSTFTVFISLSIILTMVL